MTLPYAQSRILKVLTLAVVTSLCAPALEAQDERKIAEVKERIHKLEDEAERLIKRGRVNQGEKLLVEARELKNRLVHGKHKGGSDDYHGLFTHLKKAIGALRELGRKEDAQKLGQYTEELYADLQRRRKGRDGGREGNDERAAAKRQLAILRYAKAAFAEEGKKDALDMIERAMHARELQLEGRRDREARQIIERAPGREEMAELLGWAAKILTEYRAHEKAAAVKKLAGQMARRGRGRGEQRREGQRTERQVAQQQVEVMQFAARVLDEAKRGDASERMQHAAKALSLRLRDKRNAEIEAYIKKAPGREEIAKMLGLTTEILQDWGQRDRAEMVAKTARQFAPRRRGRGREREQERERPRRERERERPRRERERRRTDSEARMDELTKRLERMARALEELQEQVQRLKRQTR